MTFLLYVRVYNSSRFHSHFLYFIYISLSKPAIYLKYIQIFINTFFVSLRQFDKNIRSHLQTWNMRKKKCATIVLFACEFNFTHTCSQSICIQKVFIVRVFVYICVYKYICKTSTPKQEKKNKRPKKKLIIFQQKQTGKN